MSTQEHEPARPLTHYEWIKYRTGVTRRIDRLMGYYRKLPPTHAQTLRTLFLFVFAESVLELHQIGIISSEDQRGFISEVAEIGNLWVADLRNAETP